MGALLWAALLHQAFKPARHPLVAIPLRSTRGDVTLECTGTEPVTVAATTFDGGKHLVTEPAAAPVPAGAPKPAFA